MKFFEVLLEIANAGDLKFSLSSSLCVDYFYMPFFQCFQQKSHMTSNRAR